MVREGRGARGERARLLPVQASRQPAQPPSARRSHARASRQYQCASADAVSPWKATPAAERSDDSGGARRSAASAEPPSSGAGRSQGGSKSDAGCSSRRSGRRPRRAPPPGSGGSGGQWAQRCVDMAQRAVV